MSEKYSKIIHSRTTNTERAHLLCSVHKYFLAFILSYFGSIPNVASMYTCSLLYSSRGYRLY